MNADIQNAVQATYQPRFTALRISKKYWFETVLRFLVTATLTLNEYIQIAILRCISRQATYT